MRPVLRCALLTILILWWPSLGKAADLEKLLEYRNLNGIDVSPDGALAVFVTMTTDLDENTVNSNLWSVKLSTGRAAELTSGAGRVAAPAWSPDGEQVAYLSRRQIWTIPASGGNGKPATRFPRVGIAQYRWLPDGRGFVFVAQDPPRRPEGAMGPRQGPGGRPGGGGPQGAQRAEQTGERRPQNRPIVVDAEVLYNRLYRFVAGEQRPERLLKEDFHVRDFDISPDEKKVVFTGQAHPGRSFSQHAELRVLDLETGNVRVLATGLHSPESPRFSPDGSWIAFAAGEGDRRPGGRVFGEISFLWIVRPDGSGLRQLTKSFDESIQAFEWAADGKTIFFQAFQPVSMKAFRLDLASGKYQALPAFPGPGVCQDLSFAADGKTGAAMYTNAHTPLEVYRLDNAGEKAQKLTGINEAFTGMAPETEVIQYRSDDGLEVEALVWKPKDFQAGKRYPLLVIVHGGPAGIFRHMFTPRLVAYPTFAFMEQGYVLLLVNPRGTAGYGESFRRGNIGDLGGGDYRDIMASVDLLIEQGVADPDRMGLMGWSYGGEMAYWTVTQTDRFKAISAGAGLTNLISHYGTGQAKGYGQHDGIWGAPPWENPQIYLDHSALMFVQNAKTPLLIQHGENDPTVPVSQAHEFYAAAKRVGLPVQMVIYQGQGHGITEPKLAMDAMQRNLDWFNKYVRGIEPQPEIPRQTRAP